MSFEVPVANVSGRRRGWPVPAAVAGFIALVVVAAAAGGPGERGPAAVRGAPVGQVDEASAPAAPDAKAAGGGLAPAVDVPRLVRALPADIDCRDVEEVTCLRLARAAIVVLPDDLPAVRDATVWRSLLCNDNFDCPSRYLAGSSPLGSVVVRFVDDSPRAAINVVDWRYSANIRLGTRAWVARWLPGSG